MWEYIKNYFIRLIVVFVVMYIMGAVFFGLKTNSLVGGLTWGMMDGYYNSDGKWVPWWNLGYDPEVWRNPRQGNDNWISNWFGK